MRSERGDEAEAERSKFVAACRLRSRIFAEMVAEILEKEGIPCYVKGDDSSIFGVAGFGGQDQLWPAIIMAAEEDVERVKEICRQYAETSPVKSGS